MSRKVTFGKLVVITFGLLGIAICSVWIHPVKIGKRISLSPWLVFALSACVSGLIFGYLEMAAIAVICVFGAAAYLTSRINTNRIQKIIFGTITTILALYLAMHRVYGFNNPKILESIKFSTDAALFTQYANFDKGVVGLILLVFFCKRTTTIAEFVEVLKRSIPMAVSVNLLIISTAVAIGYVRLDLKLPSASLVFLATNLLFTVIAEESFFRGLLQNYFDGAFQRFRFGSYFAVIASAVLFGLMHIGGGINYSLLAIISGFGYAYGFFVFRRIEAPIFMHFALNAVHFFGFTYPYIE